MAEGQLLERDHLFQVANITRGQIKKLTCAGITTMQDLADTPLIHVAGINPLVLERLKAQAAIQKVEVVVPEITEEKTQRTELRDRLLEQASRERETNPEHAQLTETMAWVLEFHSREAKPVFWRMFDRLGLSHEELLDDLDCLACCQRTQRPAFNITSRSRQLAYEYQFEPQEYKNVHEAFFLVGAESSQGNRIKVKFIKEESDLDNGLVVIQSKDEPPEFISLIPDEYVPTGVIEGAIQRSVIEFECGALTGDKGAIVDFLTRSCPRIRGLAAGRDIAPSHDPDKRLKQVISAVMHLDNSYLAIQGPPGAGKTHTAKHIIAELLRTCLSPPRLIFF